MFSWSLFSATISVSVFVQFKKIIYLTEIQAPLNRKTPCVLLRVLNYFHQKLEEFDFISIISWLRQNMVGKSYLNKKWLNLSQRRQLIEVTFLAQSSSAKVYMRCFVSSSLVCHTKGFSNPFYTRHIFIENSPWNYLMQFSSIHFPTQFDDHIV